MYMCCCGLLLFFSSGTLFGGDIGASDGENDAVIANDAYRCTCFYGASVFGYGLPAVAVYAYSSGVIRSAYALGYDACSAYQGVHIAWFGAVMPQQAVVL